MTADEHNSRGLGLMTERRFADAASEFRSAIALDSAHVSALNNLGNALTRLGELDDAITAYREAITLQPDLAEAHLNLAGAMKNTGDVEAALDSLRKAAGIRPDARIASALLYAMHLSDRVSPADLLSAHREWNEQFAVPLRSARKPLTNDRDPHRRLRIGYVSPDFTAHPVGRFMLPLLANHDRKQVEAICYSDAIRADAMTQMLRRAAHVWKETPKFTDAQLADQIRADRIDVLVDLTMHAAGNRLLAFARKPAPVQVTYLAYCGTTGLDTMDYRLTDSQIDPPDRDGHCTETSVRLPRTYWCYAPIVETPVAPRNSDHIAFASLNNFAKVSSRILTTWKMLLRRIPGSTLTLHTGAGPHRRRLLEFFTEDGRDPERIQFVDRVPLGQYFRQYDSIDVALDTYPFNGGTTTCDALWCGVPVISFSGWKGVSRSGRSILSCVGLDELVAESMQRYVQNAVDLATHPKRLRQLRSTMRARLKASPLLDAAGFARDIEAAYRTMWRTWCET
jgi:predicted O-linked N-acetylglucosamine transferase (SPINDLY family)